MKRRLNMVWSLLIFKPPDGGPGSPNWGGFQIFFLILLTINTFLVIKFNWTLYRWKRELRRPKKSWRKQNESLKTGCMKIWATKVTCLVLWCNVRGGKFQPLIFPRPGTQCQIRPSYSDIQLWIGYSIFSWQFVNCNFKTYFWICWRHRF